MFFLCLFETNATVNFRYIYFYPVVVLFLLYSEILSETFVKFLIFVLALYLAYQPLSHLFKD